MNLANQRTEDEMMGIIMERAIEDSHIRFVGLEGSRSNQKVPKDRLQDFDITYFVDDLSVFADEAWLDYFGERLIMQKPDESSLFPSEVVGYTYLMIFQDGNRLDLKLRPIALINEYLAADQLVTVLLDKDQILQEWPEPTDKAYWIAPPSEKNYQDCVNEFYWVATYVAKGLVRDELLYANDHLSDFVRLELLRMMSWRVGFENGYTVSIGKNHKYLSRYIEPSCWERLLLTYDLKSVEHTWQALFTCVELFEEESRQVAELCGFTLAQEEQVIPYLQELYKNGKKMIH